jgi:hypothetical protein
LFSISFSLALLSWCCCCPAAAAAAVVVVVVVVAFLEQELLRTMRPKPGKPTTLSYRKLTEMSTNIAEGGP